MRDTPPMSALAHQLFTIPEYLALEAQTGIRHEYQDGIVTAMAGGSPKHSRVICRIAGVLERSLEGKPCKPFVTDLKIKAGGRLLYPDVSVLCPPVHRDPALNDAVLNPRIVIEVLSDSTAAYDRGDKFGFYRQNLEMTDYILIDPTRPHAEHYTRQDDGDHWGLEFLGSASILRLPSIECEFPLSACYEGMELLLEEG